MNNPVNDAKVGNGDIRYTEDLGGGFVNVILRDADDGDVIVVGEDDIIPLCNLLLETINRHSLIGKGLRRAGNQQATEI